MEKSSIITRILEVIQNDILPLTQAEIQKGNKIFGAAIIKKSDLSLVVAGSNKEIENPLWHGEISCLNKYWALPDKPAPKDCLFFSTHEPCSLCLSAITWSGFDNFYYFFSYQDSRDKFQIPHDLKILQEVFNCEKGAYQKKNHYWQSYDLLELINNSSSEQKKLWQIKVQEISEKYNELSTNYQSKKDSHNIPLK